MTTANASFSSATMFAREFTPITVAVIIVHHYFCFCKHNKSRHHNHHTSETIKKPTKQQHRIMGKSGGSVRASDGMGHVVRPSTNFHRQLPSDSHIRLKLLNRLGIHQKKPPVSAAPEHRRKHALHGGGSSVPTIRKSQQAHFCLPLKDDSDDDMPSSPCSSGPTSPSSPSSTALSPYTMSLDAHEKRDLPFDMQEEGPHGSNNNSHNPSSTPPRRRIQFNSNVMVVPIPSRHAYSKRIKQAFWMDGAEIQATAERNRYEFASEGWDYQQVLEDEDMYMDVATGQLVHPCWVEDEEEDGDEGGSGESNGQTKHENTANADEAGAGTHRDEEQYLDIKAPCLKRTTSGVFDAKDVESVNDATNADNAAATA